MAFYLLFSFNFLILLYRFLRSRRIGERTILAAIFLFLLLALAVHPSVIKISRILILLETGALGVTFLWLAGGPIFSWIEKRRGERKFFQLLRNGKGPLSEIVAACRMLSEAKQGGLMAIEKKDSLENWTRSGIPLDAKIRRETLFSLFTPPGALHDGGMIIKQDRIVAGGVVFPLSKRLDLPTELGTRHRAALGMSEATDALVIIVSEETGKISLAVGAKLLYDVKSERLPEWLQASLKKRLPKRISKALNLKTAASPEHVLR